MRSVSSGVSNLDATNESDLMSFQPRLSRPSLIARAIAVLLVVLFAAGACSSSDDDTADDGAGSAGSDPTASADTDADADAGADAGTDTPAGLTCDEAGPPSALLRGANGWLPQITDAESAATIGGDFNAVLQAIETLRPIQDIEGIFGTMRQGLDNMAADIVAVQEDRYGDMVGDYSVATMNAVIGEEVCGG